jgi:CRP-like cAMP-binding protein
MPGDEIRKIRKPGSMTPYPTGRIVYSPYERAEILFVLKKGHVQLYRMSSEGRKIVMATLGPGAVFGEMVLTGQGMYDAFAEAIEDCIICSFKRRDLEKLLIAKPQVAVRLLELVGGRLREAEQRLEQTLFHDVQSQLASLLLRLQDESGAGVIRMTHEELAEHLGVYRETVTSALNKLRREKLISIRRKQIELADPLGLRRKAES